MANERGEQPSSENIQTSVCLNGFAAAAYDWNCLKNWPNLIVIDHAEDTLKYLEQEEEDVKLLKILKKTNGLKFIFLNVSVLELKFVIFWNNAPRFGEHDGDEGHLSTMNQTIDRTTVLHCIQEALEYASVTLKNCATSLAWMSRDINRHYNNTGILVKIFAADISSWGNIFQECLMKKLLHIYPKLDGLKRAFVVSHSATRCSNVDYLKLKLNELLRAEYLEEVAIGQICTFSCPDRYLFWDPSKLSKSFGTPIRQYYLGFANKCCGKFEWYWDNENECNQSGTSITGTPQSRQLNAWTNYVKLVSSSSTFSTPCVGRLLSANSDNAELEAFMFKIKSFEWNITRAKDIKGETRNRVNANLQTTVVMLKPNPHWIDLCMWYATNRFGPCQSRALLQMSCDRFWKNQENTVQILLKTLSKIFEMHVELRKSGDSGVGAESEVRILAMYCEALLCWALNGTMEPEIGKESYQQSIIDALHLHPATFGVSFFGGSDMADEEGNTDFQGLTFCNDVVIVENGELVLVA